MALTFVLAVISASPAMAQQQSGKAAKPPSQSQIKRGAAAGRANAGSPFEIKVTGAKSATVTGNDASFCMSAGPTKNSQIFALSLVGEKWAISMSAMRPQPAVGRHQLTGDFMEGVMADLIDKTTGSEPRQWTHRTVESGTLTITTSTATKLSGTFDTMAKTEAGGNLRATGKFEAQATKC